MAQESRPPSPTGTGGLADYELGPTRLVDGLGEVTEAIHRPTRAAVWIMQVDASVAMDARVAGRLAELGRRASSLRHPHLAGVYNLIAANEALFLVTQPAPGRPLAGAGDRLRRMPALAMILDDVLAALEAIHDHGVVHGDVRPELVVVDGEGRATLVGLALRQALAERDDPSRPLTPDGDIRALAELGLDLLADGPVSLRRALERAADPAARHRVTSAAALRAEINAVMTAAMGADWRSARVEPDTATADATAASAPVAGADPMPKPSSPRRHHGRRAIAVVAMLLVAVVVAAIAAGFATGRIGVATRPTGPLNLSSDVALRVQPAAGGCDTTFGFEATGQLAGQGSLVYRWERSDGHASPDIALRITPDESAFDLTQAWRFEGAQVVQGSVTFHLVKPVERTVTRSFTYTCP